ncbi:MAG: hypothetical protein O2931_04260 [Planctomycetota bacterium]|nr:hypothetical protein [Planctomycetota bacterium]MDA1177994.1 hypothetical protein [Planctomycetota bacterium]
MIAIVVVLAGNYLSAQESSLSPQDTGVTPRASKNPLERGSQWIRGKFAKPAAKDPVEADAPPQPPTGGRRSVLRAESPRSVAPSTASARQNRSGNPAVTTSPEGRSADELRIAQQVSGVEQMLKAEEERLQQQITRYAQMRDSALKKEDSNALKQIEQMERKTVATYQKRIEQVLARMPAQSPTGDAGVSAQQLPTPPTPRTRSMVPSASRTSRNRPR